MILEIEHYTVRFGSFTALNDVSLGLPRQAIGLLGPNGAGKSTLIKAILGLIKPDQGRGRFMDYDLCQPNKTLRKFVGYMPESECLIPGFNAVQYVSYCAQLNGMAPRDAFKRAHRVLYLVGLEEARYRALDTYSTGMKQRLKLAQALVHDPHLIFLDEPTNGLDPDGREEMLELIRDLAHRENRCVVLSSHLMRDVERCSEYLVILDKGQVKVQGSIRELCAGEAYRYRLRVHPEQGKEKAVAILKEKNIHVDNEHPREPQFEVRLSADLKPANLFEILSAHSIQIRQLIPRNYTVEEIYRQNVELTGEQVYAAKK
ncbi:MAG: ABC transporter ATP-binding protein [Acidobacteria bacterium]|nr:ABC transporter ATP-binding protein [Acidobacteriota bacterium]MCB9396906.1 ABC transporter ATP-binding protein [Acidobacteriota bacterium]